MPGPDRDSETLRVCEPIACTLGVVVRSGATALGVDGGGGDGGGERDGEGGGGLLTGGGELDGADAVLLGDVVACAQQQRAVPLRLTRFATPRTAFRRTTGLKAQ